jgi:hypothetical protein
MLTSIGVDSGKLIFMKRSEQLRRHKALHQSPDTTGVPVRFDPHMTSVSGRRHRTGRGPAPVEIDFAQHPAGFRLLDPLVIGLRPPADRDLETDNGTCADPPPQH